MRLHSQRYGPPGLSCRSAVLGAALLACAALDAARAGPGDLDPSFGSGGVSTIRSATPPSVSSSWVDLHELLDGRIVLGGSCGVAPSESLCVARLTASGAIDSSFGANGFRSAFPPGSGVSRAWGGHLAVEPNGRITVLGNCIIGSQSRLCHVRFDETGAVLDGGVHLFPSGNSGAAAAVLDFEGRRVLAAGCGMAICLVRLNPDGTPDSNYGSGGLSVLSGNPAFFDPAAMVAIGRGLYIAATCETPAGHRACVLGVAADSGRLDSAFGSDGRALMPSNVDSAGTAVAVEPDEGLLLVGQCQVSATERHLCLSRLNRWGLAQNTLGSGVIVTGILPGGDHLGPVLSLQSDGRAVLAVSCRDGDRLPFDVCVTRLKQNGMFDASFGALRSGRNRFDLIRDENEWVTAVRHRRNGALLVLTSGSGEGRLLQLQGGPHGAPQCGLDLDGDGTVASATDSQILARVLMGMTGDAVLAGLSLAPHATRGTWPELRRFLTRHCRLRLP